MNYKHLLFSLSLLSLSAIFFQKCHAFLGSIDNSENNGAQEREGTFLDPKVWTNIHQAEFEKNQRDHDRILICINRPEKDSDSIKDYLQLSPYETCESIQNKVEEYIQGSKFKTLTAPAEGYCIQHLWAIVNQNSHPEQEKAKIFSKSISSLCVTLHYKPQEST